LPTLTLYLVYFWLKKVEKMMTQDEQCNKVNLWSKPKNCVYKYILLISGQWCLRFAFYDTKDVIKKIYLSFNSKLLYQQHGNFIQKIKVWVTKDNVKVNVNRRIQLNCFSFKSHWIIIMFWAAQLVKEIAQLVSI